MTSRESSAVVRSKRGGLPTLVILREPQRPKDLHDAAERTSRDSSEPRRLPCAALATQLCSSLSPALIAFGLREGAVAAGLISREPWETPLDAKVSGGFIDLSAQIQSCINTILYISGRAEKRKVLNPSPAQKSGWQEATASGRLGSRAYDGRIHSSYLAKASRLGLVEPPRWRFGEIAGGPLPA
jgi:hypothetical protein